MALPKRYTDEAQFDPSSGKVLAVTPSDTVDLPYVTRRLIVGTHGAVIVITEAGDTVTLPDMGQPYEFAIRVTRVKLSTGSDIVAVY